MAESGPGARPTQTSSDPAEVRATVVVRGHVQGVGFRWWVRSEALARGLKGHARNRDDRSVEVVAQGSQEQVAQLLDLLAVEPAPVSRPGRVRFVSPPLWGVPRADTQGFRER